MARKGYTTVGIPNELITEVDKIINLKKQGYTSRGELVKDAIRNLLRHIK